MHRVGEYRDQGPHAAERLCLLRLAEDGMENLVQALPQLPPRLGDEGGREAAREGGGELGGAGAQHLHHTPQPVVVMQIKPQ